MNPEDKKFMQAAVALALKGMHGNEGEPFGAVIVKDGKIIGRGNNKVTSSNDPTAHAEVTAIREATKKLKTFELTGSTIYTSCEPCPMCLGAIYWARISRIVYAATKKDAARAGFDDAFIYKELERKIPKRKIPTIQLLRKDAVSVFDEWIKKEDKLRY